jgi:hypothetical protein
MPAKRCRAQVVSRGFSTPGGKRIHFFAPLTTAFHAHVALGSTWKDEPDLWGPIISHLKLHCDTARHGTAQSWLGKPALEQRALQPPAKTSPAVWMFLHPLSHAAADPMPTDSASAPPPLLVP